MKKVYWSIRPAIYSILALHLIGCNNDRNKTPVADTAKIHSTIDSMPVVKPPITDSSAIIITPPANDNNVIIPDTSKKSK
jgi:hypothetical protein